MTSSTKRGVLSMNSTSPDREFVVRLNRIGYLCTVGRNGRFEFQIIGMQHCRAIRQCNIGMDEMPRKNNAIFPYRHSDAFQRLQIQRDGESQKSVFSEIDCP